MWLNGFFTVTGLWMSSLKSRASSFRLWNLMKEFLHPNIRVSCCVSWWGGGWGIHEINSEKMQEGRPGGATIRTFCWWMVSNIILHLTLKNTQGQIRMGYRVIVQELGAESFLGNKDDFYLGSTSRVCKSWAVTSAESLEVLRRCCCKVHYPLRACQTGRDEEGFGIPPWDLG